MLIKREQRVQEKPVISKASFKKISKVARPSNSTYAFANGRNKKAHNTIDTQKQKLQKGHNWITIKGVIRSSLPTTVRRSSELTVIPTSNVASGSPLFTCSFVQGTLVLRSTASSAAKHITPAISNNPVVSLNRGINYWHGNKFFMRVVYQEWPMVHYWHVPRFTSISWVS